MRSLITLPHSVFLRIAAAVMPRPSAASTAATLSGLMTALVVLAAGSAFAQSADQTAISNLLHGMFDKPETKLVVAPVVVAGNYAIAGWTQAEMGGRALLRKGDKDWKLVLCAGDEIKSHDALSKVGIPEQDAIVLADNMAAEEGKLPSQQVAMFSRFQGIMMMDGGDDHQAHHEHDHGHDHGASQ